MPILKLVKDPQRRLAALHPVLPAEVASAGARGQMLDSALRLFAEQGFGGTSVRDIAAACGVQPANLYAHFPSKGHLLAEICRVGHEEFLRSMRSALLEAGNEPRAQVAAWVRAQVGFHARYSMLAVACNSEMHMLDPTLAAPILELRRHAEELMLAVIRRGVDLGEFKVPHPWLAAAMIGSPAVRVAYWYTPEFELSADEVAETYVEFAWRILGVADASAGGPPPG